ncbi:hypothetical protein DSD19_06325 [Rhodovulum sp. BSW8]|uniref:hypothetical protein n=1 Tax=Rhodovulum sp. BSW8 TaxID=2259645 RepID=UPI000DE28854|nr:hypothetical protein [Rhodovulum sp. BSW8]RBO54073.1 hypothetical protein DSD19_06325 [Rhodovulum sp. BSW8]
MTQATYVPNITHTKAQAFAFFQGVMAATASNNAGATAPTETWPNMFWADTTAKALKMRNEANSAWITLGSYATGGFTPEGVAQLTAAQAGDPLSTVFGMVSGQVLSASVGGDIERLAEGADGAPVVATGWHPYNKITVGDSATGLFWSRATSGATTTITTPDFEDGYEYTVRLMDLAPPASVVFGLYYQIFDAVSNSYGPVTTLMEEVSVVSNMMHGLGFTRLPRVHSSGGVRHVRYTLRGGPSGSPLSINTGTAHLYRRREYITG